MAGIKYLKIFKTSFNLKSYTKVLLLINLRCIDLISDKNALSYK